MSEEEIKLQPCRHGCGNKVAYNAEKCPSCGGGNPHPTRLKKIAESDADFDRQGRYGGIIMVAIILAPFVFMYLWYF